MKLNLSEAVSRYGAEAKAKLANPAVSGEPEDQLRAPLERLFADLTELCGMSREAFAAVGESSIAELKTRPDFAATLRNVLVGFIEVKAPGKGADPRRYRGHDKEQWEKLQSLPNLLYTDGNAFCLWQNGEFKGQIVTLTGDVETSGKAHGNRISFLDETEEDAFQHVSREAGAVAFAPQIIFYGSVRR